MLTDRNIYLGLNLAFKRHFDGLLLLGAATLPEPKLKTENNAVSLLIYLRTGIFATPSPLGDTRHLFTTHNNYI